LTKRDAAATPAIPAPITTTLCAIAQVTCNQEKAMLVFTLETFQRMGGCQGGGGVNGEGSGGSYFEKGVSKCPKKFFSKFYLTILNLRYSSSE